MMSSSIRWVIDVIRGPQGRCSKRIGTTSSRWRGTFIKQAYRRKRIMQHESTCNPRTWWWSSSSEEPRVKRDTVIEGIKSDSGLEEGSPLGQWSLTIYVTDASRRGLTSSAPPSNVEKLFVNYTGIDTRERRSRAREVAQLKIWNVSSRLTLRLNWGKRFFFFSSITYVSVGSMINDFRREWASLKHFVEFLEMDE